MSASLSDDLAARVRRLPLPDQQRALAFVRTLEGTVDHGPLLALAGSISAEELRQIGAAIEAGCERVDAAQR